MMKARNFALAVALAIGTAPVAYAQDIPAASLGTEQPEAGQDSVLSVDVTNQAAQDLFLAIPAMPTAQVVATAAGPTDELGRKLAQVIEDDLRNTGLFKTLGPAQAGGIQYGEVNAPTFGTWSARSAQALVQGYVRANGNGSLTVGCYLYDVALQSELVRQGFVVSPGDWRRAAHKCADAIYTRLSGEGPYFDSQVVYVAEQGPKGRRRKQIAIMDQDGANHRFLTNGQSIVLTPRLSPAQNAIVYMSYENRRPSIYLYDLGARRSRLLVSNVSLTFAPRFSPDGRWVLFSMAAAGNTDVYRVASSGGTPQRLTNSPGIDTGGSYSPDGSRIVFESDRGGTQQLYVMNADGSNQRRISFGGGRYATPVWSPRGDVIAFTRMGGGAFRVGVMSPAGGGERLLTNSWGDEGPSWSPNGRVLMFFRSAQGSGKPDLWSVDLTGVNARKIPTPLDGSDPNWGPIRP
ncbi:Tol-Pal system beta propeller repeat protein TolB [Sphingomonas sp. M1-B02]|uniref:Tol-Pal system beta propeller repeat protein TolB n=1 Tax=Sphingomonas sp. M1-B02 TaxID=3114300 RepID=UPI00223F5C51|nr:Tol-Pal system beta propeller repeat protein TolB [Sphingomonas sp. S6-11]UZK65772.1 Tol-Pal system beta propeller repeat protein TolB [Sphingomonas sp. S6-11]